MISYIYLSSDTQLLSSEIANNNTDTKQAIIHTLSNSTKPFCFEQRSDLRSQTFFGFSKHFSEAKYQVVSINRYLPVESSKNLNQQNKNALQELFAYITDHFDHTQATYVEILFCLHGFENAPLAQEKLIAYEWLSIDDLHYSEQKFIRIDTKMTEFIFRRKTA